MSRVNVESWFAVTCFIHLFLEESKSLITCFTTVSSIC